jgi:hypothetical protein
VVRGWTSDGETKDTTRYSYTPGFIRESILGALGAL